MEVIKYTLLNLQLRFQECQNLKQYFYILFDLANNL